MKTTEQPFRVPGLVVLCCAILLVTSLAKFISLFSAETPLSVKDAILGLENQYLLSGIAVIEVTMVAMVLLNPGSQLVMKCLLFFAASALGYRFVAKLMGVKDTCPCLGYFHSWLPVPSGVINSALTLSLFFIIGVCLWELANPARKRVA